jgi:hypothetical protein
MASDPETKDQSEHRGSAGPRALAESVSRLTRPLLGKRGMVGAILLAEWSTIVGEALGQYTAPTKLAFPSQKEGAEKGGGTLHITAASGAFALELQHHAPRLIERVNAHFGYGAVARLAIKQGPVTRMRKAPPPPPAPLPPAAEKALRESLADIEDPSLRDALMRLGRRIGPL